MLHRNEHESLNFTSGLQKTIVDGEDMEPYIRQRAEVAQSGIPISVPLSSVRVLLRSFSSVNWGGEQPFVLDAS